MKLTQEILINMIMEEYKSVLQEQSAHDQLIDYVEQIGQLIEGALEIAMGGENKDLAMLLDEANGGIDTLVQHLEDLRGDAAAEEEDAEGFGE